MSETEEMQKSKKIIGEFLDLVEDSINKLEEQKPTSSIGGSIKKYTTIKKTSKKTRKTFKKLFKNKKM